MTDMRAHGQSEGKIITYGVKDRYDVLTWVDYVIKNISNDEKIIIDGLSMGSSTVLMASELDLPDNVKGIVADSGFTSPREIINIVGKKLVKFNCSFATSILNIYCKIFGKFSLDLISNCKSNVTISPTSFTQIHQLFTFCSTCHFFPSFCEYVHNFLN